MSNELVPVERGLVARRRGVPAALRRPLGEEVEAAVQAAAHSEHSARAYRHAIGLFLEYLGAALGGQALAQRVIEGKRHAWAFAGDCATLRRVEPSHLAGFRSWREAQGDSPNTASQREAAAISFLSVCYRDGILSDAQALAMGLRPYKGRLKRDRRPVGRRLSREEVQALRAAASGETNKAARDLAILDTMLYAGLRVEEVARLRLDNLVQDGGRWWFVFRGKGEKTRRVKVHDQLYGSLSEWLKRRGLEVGRGEGPLFLNVHKGDAIGARPLNTASLNRLVAEYGAKAGLAPERGANRLSPHDLRRTFARNAYDGGAPLPLIQAALGHADVSTTMQYIGAGEDPGGGAIDYVRY